MAFKDKEKEIAYKKQYYQDNKERLDKLNKSRNKAWREKHTEKLKEISKEFYLDNKLQILEKQKLNYTKANIKSRDNTKNLTDGYMRKHLLKLGYTRQQIRKNPELLITHKLIILLKRETRCKKNEI